MKKVIWMITVFLSVLIMIIPFGSAYSASNLPAFPGAEGGGKYSLGARGASSVSVYHVTNLNASGTGSFKDAVSKSGRIIVFDVSGTIKLTGTLTINQSNLTILGQTAPGDGITFTGGDILIGDGKENIIMRYLRVRPTDENGGEPDGIGGRWTKNVIIDHCSTSWSVDEMLTLYAGSSENSTPGSNNTVQYTIASESLRMSNHFKGAHGYGAIFGATNSTWHHNLLAHHDSRSPRLDRELQNTDVRNNVIYNWGLTNSAYGAEPYSYNNVTQNPSKVNWVNNYYKYGPGTADKLKSRIFDVSNNENVTPFSQFYISGNYVYGYPTITSNNWSGVNNSSMATQLSDPIDMGDYELSETQTAEAAYETVLNEAGATLPRRDAIDARIVADVRNQTGRIINNADEVGGATATLASESRVFTIPDSWKTANSMGSAAETDIVPSGSKWEGYTWIEAYVNDWTENQAAPTNPSITVISPAIQDMNSLGTNNNWAVISDNETLNYKAVAAPTDSTTISKIEIFDGAEIIQTINGSNADVDLTLSAGTHYLTSKAYNNIGEATQSPTSIVYVKSTKDAGRFSHAQIGTTPFNGQGGSWLDDNGTYTILGSGKLSYSDDYKAPKGVSSDSCDFMYTQLEGDFDVSIQMSQIPKFENGSVAGLMLRESLDPKSRMVMLADGWLKYGENVRIFSRLTEGSASAVSWFNNTSGTAVSNNTSGYDTSNSSFTMPKYMRMQRSGDTITLSVSNNGTSWTNNPRQPQTITISGLSETLYVGLAVDSIQGVPKKEYMAEAEFSNLKLAEGTSDAMPTATPDNSIVWDITDMFVNDDGSLDTSKFPSGSTSGRYNVTPSSIVDYNGLTYLLTADDDNAIQSSSKLFDDGYKSTWSLKTTNSGSDTNRAFVFTPKTSGTLKIYATSGSTGKTVSLTAKQAGNVIETISLSSGIFEVKTISGIDANEEVTLTAGGNIQYYRLVFLPDAEEVSATPKPTSAPTATPKIPEYNINVSSDIKNGSIEINGSGQSTVTWEASEHIQANATEGDTIYDAGETVLINGSDANDGTFILYDTAYYYIFSDSASGNTSKYISGATNPIADPPFSSTNKPKGNVLCFTPANDGIITLELWINGNKLFNLYDNNSQSYVTDLNGDTLYQKIYGVTDIQTISFPCAASNEYYVWAIASKVGLKSVTVTSGGQTAKEGETVSVSVNPDDGFRISSVYTDPICDITKLFDGKYSFIMPKNDVTVYADFVSADSPTATSAPTASPTSKPSAPTAAPTSTPTASPTSTPTAAPTSTPTASPTSTPTASPQPLGIYYENEPELNGTTLSYKVVNNTSDRKAIFAVAVYDSAYEILKDIEVKIIEPGTYEDEPITINKSSGDKFKIFLWNDLYQPIQ